MLIPLFLVDRYRHYLCNSYPEHVKAFEDRLSANPPSAGAEVLGYFFFSVHTDKVYLEEDRTDGGVDFRCCVGDFEYVVEVTHLDSDSITCRSGLPNEVPCHTGEGRFYSMITTSLLNTVRRKTKQMSGYACPRLLMIVSEHVHANSVMDSRGAELLLIYDENVRESTVFYRPKCGSWTALRQSISGILLVSVNVVYASFLGVLHPDPHYKFPIELLCEVPFAAMRTYPPMLYRNNIVWHQERPNGFGYPFRYDSI